MGMIEGLKEKVIIVTGGGHGIGKAYCFGFGKSRSRGVVADIDRPAAEQVTAQITKETGSGVLATHVDFADEKSTNRMFASARERFARIDELINNSANIATVPMNRGRIETITSDEWDKL